MDLDTAYLLASGAAVTNTANAWDSFAKKGMASIPSFFDGWLTSELPLQTLAAQAVTTAAVGVLGGLRSWRGRAGLALNIGSWAGLLALHRVATHAGDVVEQALVDGLGTDYRDRMAPDFAPPADAPISRRQVAQPFPRLSRRYRMGRNIAYGDAGRRNKLDIWSRADIPRDGQAPVLLQVHGGGWVIGNKEEQGMPLMAHMADRGWVCVAVNYRLSPRATWPDHIVDIKHALAWVKANIADHGGDPDFVTITGGSAGGHLSSLAALTPNEPEFQPGFEDADTSVRAAVPFYGVYDFTNRDGNGRPDMDDFMAKMVFKSPLEESRTEWEHASTMNWVRPDAPPFFLVHGTNDSLVPIAQARSFASMLRAESKRPVCFAELPRAQHAFEVFSSVRTLHTVRAVDRFLSYVRSEHAAGSAQPAADGEPSTAASQADDKSPSTNGSVTAS